MPQTNKSIIVVRPSRKHSIPGMGFRAGNHMVAITSKSTMRGFLAHLCNPLFVPIWRGKNHEVISNIFVVCFFPFFVLFYVLFLWFVKKMETLFTRKHAENFRIPFRMGDRSEGSVPARGFAQRPDDAVLYVGGISARAC